MKFLDIQRGPEHKWCHDDFKLCKIQISWDFTKIPIKNFLLDITDQLAPLLTSCGTWNLLKIKSHLDYKHWKQFKNIIAWHVIRTDPN